jgi:hypothetical protein
MILDKLRDSTLKKTKVHLSFFLREDMIFLSLTDNNSSQTESFSYAHLLSKNPVDLFPVIAEDINLNLRTIENITVYFGAPDVISEIRTITYSQPQEFLYTTTIARDLLMRDQHLWSDTSESKSVFVEQKAFSTKLNGYHLENPYEKRCTHVEIKTMVSISSSEYISRIRESLILNFHPKEIFFKSHTWDLYESYMVRTKKELHCFVFDFDHMHSTILSISEGLPEAIYMIPVGIHHLDMHLAQHCHIRKTEVPYLFIQKKGLDTLLFHHTKDQIAHAFSAWFSLYNPVFTMSALSRHGYLPHTLYIYEKYNDRNLVLFVNTYLYTQNYFDSQFTKKPYNAFAL